MFRNRNAGAGQHGEDGHSCPFTPVPFKFHPTLFQQENMEDKIGDGDR